MASLDGAIYFRLHFLHVHLLRVMRVVLLGLRQRATSAGVLTFNISTKIDINIAPSCFLAPFKCQSNCVFVKYFDISDAKIFYGECICNHEAAFF